MNIAQRLEIIGLKLITENIAEGGSAILHKAQVVSPQENLPTANTFVAVKQYRDSILKIPGQAERVRQEAELGQRIKNSNLVQAYGLSQKDDLTLLLLEWIDGDTLEGWYKSQKKPVEWATLQQILIGVAKGLGALHSSGVCHRDIKPENIMVRLDGQPILMDIGVAEITANTEHTLHTSVKDFVGSIRTAAPQFIMGEKYDIKDDIYSLGTTCFFLFTGKRVFDDVERKPVLPILVVTSTPTVATLHPNIPAPMKVLLEAMLHRSRERRPTLPEFLECIENPDNASFINKEIDKQGAEKRSYCVINVLDNGSSFFADLAGDNVRPGQKFTIVRKLASMEVPSYRRKISPEKWIAEAELKHVYQNAGFFKVIGKHWEESPLSRSGLFGLAGSGHWVEHEKSTDTVQNGDLVLKDSTH